MDSLLLSERIIEGVPSVLAVVCDGVGSLSDGGFAGVESVRQLSEWFSALTSANRIALSLRDKVLSINSSIISSARQRGLNTATTLSALVLIGNQYNIVHAGDSRVYEVCSAGLNLMTVDNVSRSGKLTSCIGYFDNPELLCTDGIAKCGTFLLCSDGLYKHVDDIWLFRQINSAHSKPLQNTLTSLTDYAISQGERDNISAVIIKMI